MRGHQEDDEEIDRILARGGLGGPRHDQILNNVLKAIETDVGRAPRAAARLRPRFWLALFPSMALVSVAALWLAGWPRPAQPRAKGSARVASAAVDLGCGPDGAHLCHQGDTLMFRLEGTATAATRYLTAYAERRDDPTHTRLWYFPTAAGLTPAIPSQLEPTVARDGIEIGNEHQSGDYRVTVCLSPRPLRRAEVDGMVTDPASQCFDLGLRVVGASRVAP